jgi:hypothetical protein
MRSRRRSVLFGSVFAFLLFTQAAFAGVPTEVKTTNRDEFLGSANANFFSWTQDRAGHPRARDAWYEPTPVGSGTPVRLNAAGDKAYSGQIDPATDQIGWQRIHNGHSDVRVYDMSGQANVPLPAGINTSKWEWGPAVYSGQMTFARDGRRGQTIFLVDLTTGTKQVIKTTDYTHTFLFLPPRFYGNWIVYMLATRNGWNVYEYDVTNGTTRRVPNPNDKLYYAPSVDLAGNVYFIRSGFGCAVNVRLMKWTRGGGDPVVVYAFDSTHDANDTSVYDDGAGTVQVFAAFYDCENGRDDIYSFTNPTAAPVGRGSDAAAHMNLGPKVLGEYSGVKR